MKRSKIEVFETAVVILAMVLAVAVVIGAIGCGGAASVAPQPSAVALLPLGQYAVAVSDGTTERTTTWTVQDVSATTAYGPTTGDRQYVEHKGSATATAGAIAIKISIESTVPGITGIDLTATVRAAAGGYVCEAPSTTDTWFVARSCTFTPLQTAGSR